MKNKVTLKIIKKGLTYEQAKKELLENGACITRPEWKGYHFRFFNHYCIRLKDGNVLVDPKEIYDTDKKDWIVVKIEDSNEFKKVYQKLNRLIG